MVSNQKRMMKVPARSHVTCRQCEVRFSDMMLLLTHESMHDNMRTVLMRCDELDVEVDAPPTSSCINRVTQSIVPRSIQDLPRSSEKSTKNIRLDTKEGQAEGRKPEETESPVPRRSEPTITNYMLEGKRKKKKTKKAIKQHQVQVHQRCHGEGTLSNQGQAMLQLEHQQLLQQSQGQLQQFENRQVLQQGQAQSLQPGNVQVLQQASGQLLQLGSGLVYQVGQGQLLQLGNGHVLEQGHAQIQQQGNGQLFQEGQGQILQLANGQVHQQLHGPIVQSGQGQVLQSSQDQGQILGQVVQQGHQVVFVSCQGQPLQFQQGHVPQTGHVQVPQTSQGQVGNGQFQELGQSQATQDPSNTQGLLQALCLLQQLGILQGQGLNKVVNYLQEQGLIQVQGQNQVQAPSNQGQHVDQHHVESVEGPGGGECPDLGSITADEPGEMQEQNVAQTSSSFSVPTTSKTTKSKRTKKELKLLPSDDRPHKCPTCSRGFKSAYDLKRHRSVHTSDKPFKCDKCPLSFSENIKLVRHLQRHEKGELKYSCSVCHGMFVNQGARKTHQSSHSYTSINSNQYTNSTVENTDINSGNFALDNVDADTVITHISQPEVNFRDSYVKKEPVEMP